MKLIVMLIQCHFIQLQTVNIVNDARVSDTFAHHPGYPELHLDADIHDVQCLAVRGCCNWCRRRLLPVWMEKICIRRCNRALSLDILWIIL